MKCIFSNCRGSLGSLLKINNAASALKSRFRRSDMVLFLPHLVWYKSCAAFVVLRECSAPFSCSRYEMDLNLAVAA